MDEYVPFASSEYFVFVVLLLFGRGMDFLSTWIATPNMLLEANPLARRMRWRWGIPINLALCAGFGLVPLTAIIITTTSVLVAARNFHHAWIMRSWGEENYRAWFMDRLDESRPGLFLICLLGHACLPGSVGGALLYFGNPHDVATLGVGLGIIGYAAAVLIFTFISLFRYRRSLRKRL
jgi:hypothetical protein